MCVTPWVPPIPSATSATRGRSPSVRVSLSFSRPRNAVAAAYGIAGIQASNSSEAARLRSGEPALLDHRDRVVNDSRELTLVDAARAAVEVLVADVAVLQMLDEPALVDLQAHRP